MNPLARRHTPDERGRGSTADAVALVRSLGVVIVHEAVEGALQGRAAGEVAAPEHHAPELLEDRALQPFDEAVGPGMAGFRTGVPKAELATGDIKGPLEFRPAVGEHTPHRPAGTLEVGHDDLAQERGGGRRIVGRQPASETIRGRRGAGRHLPNLADPFEIADVEGVQAHELAGLVRLDVSCVAMAGTPEGASRAVGQQPGRARRLLLEHGEPGPPPRPGDPAPQPLHGAGSHADLPRASQVSGDPAAAPGSRADRDAQRQPLHLWRGCHRTTRAAALPARMHAVDPIAFQPFAPAIEGRPGEHHFAAEGADGAEHMRALDDAQSHSVYALVEGHRSVLPQWVPWPEFHSGKDRADDPLVRSRQLLTLFRVRTD